MACGATLKRSMEFEALLSPQSQSPKRRRCTPLPGAPLSPSTRQCGVRPEKKRQKCKRPPLLPSGYSRQWSPTEQIFENIKQEYSRYQRRRQLEVSFNQSEGCSAGEANSHTSAPAAPNSPGTPSVKRDQPTFTLRQVGVLCERLLKDHEEKIREEYEQILNLKLAEQYESFVKFTHDQIMRRYGARPASYVS
nr:PREDICTED: akirin-1 [Latimeria chalumnae]|eukprot:XP_014353932.1 PREDICTED: akirin-1 [Latimeria chalumnae]